MSEQQPRVVLGPLTTTFTPPSRCAVAAVAPYPCGIDCSTAFRAQLCTADQSEKDGFLQDDTSCWPSATPGVSKAPPLNGWGFYSPGWVCPSGYTTACSATAGGSSGWSVEYAMVPGETAMGCCPSGFTCSVMDTGQTCQSDVGYQSTYSLETCSSGKWIDPRKQAMPYTTSESFYVTRSSSSFVAASQTIVSTKIILAPMVELRWRSSDESALKAATQTASGTSSSGSGSSGLSTGDTIGIAVAIPVAALIALGAILYICYRRRSQKSGRKDLSHSNHEQFDKKQELPGNPVYHMNQHGKNPYEGGQHHIYEMDHHRHVFEPDSVRIASRERLEMPES